MQTITFFANKGGSGRTTSTMALASGFLAQGNRVAVMDCSDLAGCKVSPLRAWIRQMVNDGFGAQQVDLIECKTSDQVKDAAAAAHASGVDVLLVDTSARIFEPQIVALNFADLIIAPAISSLESKRISASIGEYLDASEKMFGLVIKGQNDSLRDAETREGFGYHSVLKSELPWCEALSEQMLNGDIAQLVVSLACKPGEPGLARFRQAQAAFTVVQRLAFEVEWALGGQRLERFANGPSQFFSSSLVVA